MTDPNYGNRDSYARDTLRRVTAPSGRTFMQNVTDTYRITMIPDRGPAPDTGPRRTRAPFRVTFRALSDCGRFWHLTHLTTSGESAQSVRLASRSEGRG